MHESTAKYQSYLLRLWQEGEHALWHASAQHVQTKEIVHFADLEALITFLWAQTAPNARPQEMSIHSDIEA